VAQRRTLGYQPDFVLTLKAFYNGTARPTHRTAVAL
jgi:hypothetical protein